MAGRDIIMATQVEIECWMLFSRLTPRKPINEVEAAGNINLS